MPPHDVSDHTEQNEYEGFEDVLVARGVLDAGQLESARTISRSTGEDFVEVIVERGLAPRQAVMSAMSQYLGIPYRSLVTDDIDPRAVKRIPRNMAFESRVIPVSIDAQAIVLAACAPLDVQAQENLSFASGLSPAFTLCDWPDIRSALDHFYPRVATSEEELVCVIRLEGGRLEEEECIDSELDEEKSADLLDRLIASSVKRRASDIYIEPGADKATIRFRVDGVVGKVQEVAREVYAALVSRAKILSELDIGEKRRPQDGVIFMTIGDKDVDFRVATVPTIYGESLTMRVLDQTSTGADMRLLGFEENDLAIVLQALREPSGLILNTGPTGCGKTTTMYSMLRNLDGMATKIVTIEDPVEYRMENATQIPVNNAIGMGFAPLLRSVLRHDPDTILVGEIRDAETAHTAAQAGLTGHLLLSTLHTTDAPEVLLRLMEMGVEHFYIRAVVKLIVAQRLARKPCPQCRVSYKASADELSEMGLPADQSVDIFRAVGCPACSSGYRDRTGIFQVMPMTPKIEELMVPGVQLDAIRREALDDGMRTLWQNGVKKVLEGQTTLEEIRRVLPR